MKDTSKKKKKRKHLLILLIIIIFIVIYFYPKVHDKMGYPTSFKYGDNCSIIKNEKEIKGYFDKHLNCVTKNEKIK